MLFQKFTGWCLKRSCAWCIQAVQPLLCRWGRLLLLGLVKVGRDPRGAVNCPKLGLGVQLQSRAGPGPAACEWLSWPRPGRTNTGREPMMPDRLGAECQDAWNSQSIGQTSWKYGQEPMQMATEGCRSLLGVGWTQVQMLNGTCQECSSLLTCVTLSLHGKGVGLSDILLASGILSPF